MKSEWKTIGKFNPIRFTYKFFPPYSATFKLFSTANILFHLVDLLHIKYDSVIDFSLPHWQNLTRKYNILPN